MARKAGSPAHLLAFYRALEAEPYRFGFFQVLRRLECLHRDKPRIGESVRPGDDPVRLAQEPILNFPPATLASFKHREGRPPRLEAWFLGLFGPQGPLPLHLTEYARDRLRHAADPTFARFADIFHHRMLSLFYRAWAMPQPAVNLDRPELSRYLTHIGALFGIGRPSLRNRDAVTDVTKVHYAGWLACQARHAEGLQAMLGDYFKVAVKVKEFIGTWIPVPEAGRYRVGRAADTSCLGLNIIVGTRIWEGQQKFRIQFGPLSYRDYRRLLPGGDSLRRLVAMVRNYLGDELDWEVQLVLKKNEVPSLQLGEHVQLGWSAWLAGPPRPADPADLHLNPLAFA